MSVFHWEIEASAGPAREGLLGGAKRLLVRVRMFDDCAENPSADALVDLRPTEARRLARQLLAAAQDAERQTEQAGFWEQAR
jgi:hypothetical protein